MEPCLYNKQCKLFHLRWCFLKEKTNYGPKELSFLSTQSFDLFLDKPDLWKLYLKYMPEESQRLGQEIISKFLIPAISSIYILNLHTNKDDGQCECEVCISAFVIFKSWIKRYPDSGPFIKLAIRSSSIRSLKTVCMAKVVELGLAQDCLPLSVLDTIRKGPELGEVDRRTERSLEMAERAIKDCDL